MKGRAEEDLHDSSYASDVWLLLYACLVYLFFRHHISCLLYSYICFMLNRYLYGYLSPNWKRLVRTVAIINCLYFLLLGVFEDLDSLFFLGGSLIIANALLSYSFEGFVKKNQKSELWVSLAIIADNALLFIIFHYLFY